MSEASRTEELIENAEPEDFDLGKVLESTIAAYADAWPERRFTFDNHAMDTQVFGSPELIIQMLDKLADNAVEFSDEGDDIRVALSQMERDVVRAWEKVQVAHRATQRYAPCQLSHHRLQSLGGGDYPRHRDMLRARALSRCSETGA